MSFSVLRTGAFSRTLVLFFSGMVFLAGCDSTDPIVDDHEPITRVEVELRHEVRNEPIISSIIGAGGLTSGSVYEADTLVVEPGSVYTGRVKIYDSGDGEFTQQIRSAAENFQLFYNVTGASGVDLAVTDVESDYSSAQAGPDLHVGLVFELTVADGILVNDGHLRIRLGDFGPGLKNGVSLTVVPLVDVLVPFRVEIPPPPPRDPRDPEEITQAVLTMTRADGTEIWTATAWEWEGLVSANYEVPTNMNIVGCIAVAGGSMPCSEYDSVNLLQGVYTGEWELSNFDTGQSYTEEIRSEGLHHQFFYQANFGSANYTILDMDANGMPLGLSFELNAPSSVIIGAGSLRIRLGHFLVSSGDIKNGTNGGQEEDLRFRIPMRLYQTGLPETITRSVLNLSRADGLESITVTAVGSDLSLHGALPGSLVVETCTGPTGQQVCVSGGTLELTHDRSYTGVIEVFDDVTGEDVMQKINESDIWHSFAYLSNLDIVSTATDADANGEPIGFQFTLTAPSAPAQGTLQVILSHFGRLDFKFANGISGIRDMDFSIPTAIR